MKVGILARTRSGPPRTARLGNVQVPLWSIVHAGVQMGVGLLSARWLGPADRGHLVLATTLGSLLLLIASMGTGAASRVVLAEPGSWWTWSRYLRLAGVLTAVHVAFSATVGAFLLSLLSSAGPGVQLGFVLYSATALIGHLVRDGLHGLGQHRTSVVIDVVAAVVQLCLIVVAYTSGNYSPTTALCIASACFSGAAAVGVVLGRRGEGSRPPGVDAGEWWRRARGLLGLSRLALVAALGQSFVSIGDRLVLGALGPAEQVGIYSAASTFAAMSGVAPMALTALITRKTAARGTLDTWRRTHVLVLSLTGLTAAAVGLCGWFVIPLLLGDAFVDARTLLPIFCAAGVPYASYLFDSAACAGLRDLRTGAVGALVGCVLLVGLAAIGYSALGSHGVACGVLVTYVLMAAIARVRLRRAASGPHGTGPRPATAGS
ncbi:lipopolysaccharide biosynthesis protein [Geodermatophilus sp. SYSU D01106]